MRTNKLIKFSDNDFIKTEPLVDITIKKGEKTNISWGCLSALVEAKIALTHAKILLNEENLKLKEGVLEDEEYIEGTCFKL